jgi:hypothetical protein
MTTFFNKKEEVIDLQLTPYGEALLSVGQLKPVYYAFFDDDVLYDASGSAGILEVQNDVEPRIQENTPNTKVQTTFSGIETNLHPLISDLRYEESIDITGDGRPDILLDVSSDRDYEAIPPNIDQYFSLAEPLGTMEIGSLNAPSWKIEVLKGELTGAVNYMTGSRSGGADANVVRIPQLGFDLNYRVLVGHTSLTQPNLLPTDRLMSDIYPDGTFLYLSEDPANIILVVDEENTPLDLEYDIEVFEIEDDRSDVETPTLRSLSFVDHPSPIVDGILLDDAETIQPPQILNSNFVEYFFMLNTDRQIASEEICPVLDGVQTRGVILNNLPYDCDDVLSVGRFDIYGTNATARDECDD